MRRINKNKYNNKKKMEKPLDCKVEFQEENHLSKIISVDLTIILKGTCHLEPQDW